MTIEEDLKDIKKKIDEIHQYLIKVPKKQNKNTLDMVKEAMGE